MARQIIRLTESDLHKIIENTVRRIVKEVKFGGESFHGNDEADWRVMGDLRHDAVLNSKNDIERNYHRQARQRDYDNSRDVPNSAFRSMDNATAAMNNRNSPAGKYHAQMNYERANQRAMDVYRRAGQKYQKVKNNLNPSKK